MKTKRKNPADDTGRNRRATRKMIEGLRKEIADIKAGIASLLLGQFKLEADIHDFGGLIERVENLELSSKKKKR